MNVDQFYQTLKQNQSHKHTISLSTSTPPSTPESFPSNVPLLDYYVRPQEIQSCTWSVDKFGNTPTPRDCACTDIPNSAACVNGYETVKTQVKDSVLEKNPDSAIEWCVQNVPTPFSETATLKHSWIIGCLDGIRGVHKVL